MLSSFAFYNAKIWEAYGSLGPNNFRLHTNAIVNQKMTGLKVEKDNNEKTKTLRLPEATSSLKKIIHLPNYILLKSISIIELCCRLDNAKTYSCFKATLGQYHINTVDHKFKNINQRVYFETMNHLHQGMH